MYRFEPDRLPITRHASIAAGKSGWRQVRWHHFALLALALVFGVGQARAASYVVDTVTDDGGLTACTAAADDCSLRGAIADANAAGGSNTITFDSTVFNPGTITLSSGTLIISSDLTITGAGQVTISGNNAYRIISVQSGVDTLDGLTLTEANFSGSGAALVNNGSLTLSNSTISNSAAVGAGSNGGGIYNGGILVVLSSTINGNSADRGGGVATANSATTYIVNSTFTANSATSGGGGTFAGGSITVTNSTYSGNSTSGNGDEINLNGTAIATISNSILANGAGSGGDCSKGGGSSVTIQYSLVKDGSCSVVSGVNNNLTGDPQLRALANNGGITKTMALQSGSPAIDAASNSLARDQSGNTLTVDQRGAYYIRKYNGAVDMGAYELIPLNLRVDLTSDADVEGCTYVADDCTLRGAINLANRVGGANTIVFNTGVFSPGTITLTSDLPAIASDITIDGLGPSLVTVDGATTYNIFRVNSGAIATFNALTIADGYYYGSGGNGGGAGGIANYGSTTVTNSVLINNGNRIFAGGAIYNEGTLVVKGSTLVGNFAYFGGGIDSSGGATTVINSTLTGSSANIGAGVYVDKGTATVTNSTIEGSDGAGIERAGGTVNLNNSIVASSSGGNDCAGTVTVQHSLIQDGSCGAGGGGNGNLTGDPMLGPLADHGGLTQTMALLTGSPAIDAGSNTLAVDENSNPLTTDQRGSGYARIVGGVVDMGAYEAHDLVVDTTSDADLEGCSSAANDCSLRGAINLADSFGGDSTISFDSSVFTPGTTITLTSDLPQISSDMNVTGLGHTKVLIFGADTYHPFTVAGGVTASITGMSLLNGFTSGSGGGITNDGTLTVTDVAFSHTSATLNGGGISNSSTGTLTLSSGNFIQTSAVSGGGLYNQGGATVSNTAFFKDTGSSDGGGIALSGSSASLIVTGSTFTGSSSTTATGGAIFIANSATANVSGSTFSGNTSSSDGGAVALSNSGGSLTVSGSTFSGNHTTGSGSSGGAINSYATMTVIDTTFSNNSATQLGGAIYNSDIGAVNGSTFNGNSSGQGGGITAANGTMTVVNSTVTGNQATNTGGGIYIGAGTLTVTNSTIAGNVATGGGIFNNGGTVDLYNSILAGNSDGVVSSDCAVGGSYTVNARNTLIQDGLSCVTGTNTNNLTGDPLLGALAANGGPTQTMALLAGSPAINAGSNALAVDENSNPLSTDQRGAGFARIVIGTVDMGAYEYVDTTAPTVTSFSATSPTSSLNIPITAFTATDDVGVTGYLITESATPPSAGAAGWSGTAPSTYSVSGEGSYTLYPWAKDASGNVSAVYGSPVSVIVDTTAPTVTGFAAPTPTNSLAIPITTFTATDANGVTGYLITESSTPPSAGNPGWSPTAPTTYTVAGDGSYTLYPWAKDGAGNVSAVYGSPASVVVDTTAPVVTGFAATSPTNSLDIPITTFTATDANGVIGYLITESSTPPSAGNPGWSPTAPTTYTVASDGSYTLYPWAKDAAGNVSAVYGSPASVTVDTTPPSLQSFTRFNPATQTTSADTLVFQATFSEAVQNVDATDFSVIGGSTATISSVTTSDSTVWNITVSGGDLAGYNGGVGLLLAGSEDITDATGNPLPNTQPATDETYIETNARVCYVDGSVSGGANDGTSWANAYVDLQSALTDTQCSEVWVATGVYKPGTSDPTSTFAIRPGVAVYGGFVGTETNVNQRVPAIDTTILSGDIDGNDCGGSGCPNGVDSDYTQIAGTNSYHVVAVDGRGLSAVPTVTATTVLDGFTITGGDAEGSFPNGAGGGLLCNAYQSGKCSPTLSKLTFSGNNSGGAGGAIYVMGNASLASPTLTDVTFADNHAASFGGAMYNDGAHGGMSAPLLTNVTFSGNKADTSGGALYDDGLAGTSSPTLINVSFTGNDAPQGGAIYNSGSVPLLSNVILWGDSAATSGPEMLNSLGSAPSVAYSLIAGGCPSGATCSNTLDTDPLLGTLGDNGGYTRTLALAPGSPAVSAGTNTRCPATDQRGVTRPQGASCDIGAYELLDEIFKDGFEGSP